MPQLGITLIVVGVGLVLIGLLLTGKLGPLGRLPGDILIERENFTLYVPVVTMLLVSVVITLVLWFLNR